MKVKPIFIISLPQNTEYSSLLNLQAEIEKKMPDYHCLVTFTRKDDPEFKVFYEKDFNEVKLDELKEIVKKGLPKTIETVYVNPKG